VRERGDKVRLQDFTLVGLAKLVVKELIRRGRFSLRPYLSRDPVRRGFAELPDLIAELEKRVAVANPRS